MTKPAKTTDCHHCHSCDKGIFCDMGKDGRSEVSANKVMNSYKRGQVIFHQGNPAFGLYCVSTGKIKVTRTSNEGKESIVRIAGPGDVLGHRSLFSKENYSASATVLEDATICFLDKNYIYSVMKRDPSVSMNLIHKLSRDMGAAEARNAAMSQKNVRERLAQLFLSFKKNYGVEENGRWRIDIKLSRDEIASLVGTAHETIIRFISEFKEEGILAQEGKTLYIVDEEKLIEFANLDH